MRILIVSNTSWSVDNSFGNSFSSIFEGIEDLEFANIYCRPGLPKNKIKGRYYQITERSIVRNILNSKYHSGSIILTGDQNKPDVVEGKFFNYARKNRLQIYFWIRDLIWKIGRWKSDDLIKFIDDFKPDIIFQPLYYSTYLNDIVLFIKKHTNVPMVCYVSDDVYTLRQFSLSPLFWIDRFFKRRKIKKVADRCEYLYVISDFQKNEYEKCFGKECKILTKGADFSSQPSFKNEYSFPIRFVYTGNIGAGRWKSLAMIGRALKEINKKEIKAQLYIYSTTPLTRSMKRALNTDGSVMFKGGVPPEQLTVIQSEADILVHVEPLDLKGRLQVRHSFSTKLVDYFHAARAVFAVGPCSVASIDYLIKNDAAIVAIERLDIIEKIKKIIDKPALLSVYDQKAWECGKRNYQITLLQVNIIKELICILNYELNFDKQVNNNK